MADKAQSGKVVPIPLPLTLKRRRQYQLRRLKYLDIPTTTKEIFSYEYANLILNLESALRENEILEENFLRLRAEFDNFRKRSEREKKEITLRANEEMLREIVKILDQFDLALNSTGNLPENEPFVEGVKMVYKNFFTILDSQGLKKVDALGEIFNPAYHEAITVEEHPDKKQNEIIEVFRTGYKYQEKILRPALVKVAKKPS